MQFLNVNLEIESRDDLSILVEEFGEDVAVLHHGEVRGLNFLLIEYSGGTADADATINDLCVVVGGLPPGARAVWDKCCTRVFDIGYDCNEPAETFNSELRHETIQNVVSIGASIRITIYPPEPPPKPEQ